jgi:hypothetical protein
MSRVDDIKALLSQCTDAERLEVFKLLRRDFHIHPFENALNTCAEVILEAISKAPDLTIRGVRGIIAEASFIVEVVGPLLDKGWTDTTPKGDHAYDCQIEDEIGSVRVQVKMQRRKDHRPMMANEGFKRFPKDQFVVETQRTRGGKDSAGESTRPYRFGEFDILAVSLHPSSNNWHDFRYTVSRWLIPDPDNSAYILKFQPVAQMSNADWTDNFLLAVEWLRSTTNKKISC